MSAAISPLGALRRSLAEGRATLGYLVTTPSVQIVQALARTGVDWVMIDMEHAPIGIESVAAMIAATGGTPATPLVRVPAARAEMVKPVLDCGALGVVFPQIATRQEAEATVQAVRYAPAGRRGYGPTYAALRWGLPNLAYLEAANDAVLNVVLIESEAGVDALDDILTVGGLDVVAVARGDLSQSLGVPGQFEHPRLCEIVAKAEAKILAHGDVALGGIAFSADDARGMIARGYRFIVLGSDAGLISGAAQRTVQAIRADQRPRGARMQFGLFMMPLHPPYRAFADCYERDVAQIVLADRLGFGEVWVGEHLTERWENAPAPDLLLAQALALTKTVRLGTGVTLLALHNPVYLAHRLAMLDHMARGRFQWGIGGGGIPTDLSLFGLDPSTVRARSAEVLDVVLKLWASDGRFTYRGKFFDIDTPELDPVKGRGYYMKPFRQPHPPIAVAASTPSSSSMRMAGERGWIPMSSSLLSRSYLGDHWRLVEAGAAGAGRAANRSEWRIARDILVAPTRASARERARAVLGRNYLEHQYPNRIGTAQMASTKLEPSMPDEAVTVDYLMDNVWIVGDPSECADKIRQLHAESGGFGALLTITTDSDDAGWDHESLRLLMEDVAPRVADLG